MPAAAAPLVSPLKTDLDGDGRLETVALRSYEKAGETYGQLVVFRHDGQLLWQAPRHGEAFVFLGPYDRGTLELLYRHQGKVWLLASYQKSDVRPTRFRLFVWSQGFKHVRDGALLPANQRPATFEWAENPGASRWIDQFLGEQDGLLEVRVTDLQARASEQIKLRPDGDEFVLSRGG